MILDSQPQRDKVADLERQVLETRKSAVQTEF